jgi:hypothetical protein
MSDTGTRRPDRYRTECHRKNKPHFHTYRVKDSGNRTRQGTPIGASPSAQIGPGNYIAAGLTVQAATAVASITSGTFISAT